MKYRVVLEVEGTGMYHDYDGLQIAEAVRNMVHVGWVQVVEVKKANE